MSLADIKLYALNGSSLVMSFTNIDAAMKIILLAVSIGYTIQRWYLMNKDEKNK